MASGITGQELVNRVRRFLRDWPDLDSSTASISSGGTTLTVADSTIYSVNWPIEQDTETMIVRALPSGTTLTVRRGAFGSTGASHASGTSILLRPSFYTGEILDALNEGIQASYPLIYKAVIDESLTATDSVYEYTVPNMPGTYNGDTVYIPRIANLTFKESGDLSFRPMHAWEIVRGATPKLKLRRPFPAGTIRVHGLGPFPDLTGVSDTLDTQWPKNAIQLLVEYAALILLASGEAGRVRQDTGARDDREAAVRPGSSLSLSVALEGRWQRRLASVGMPPIPPHIKSVI